ncbi:DEAD/DEAH box helicase [Stomatohabitans albus]|uniref:DEAD/DEAH box helicase n=1 Tax=Stomatohabitans albus TaxID=3110766 RepID=UPI00300D818B
MPTPSRTFAELGVEPLITEALAEQGITSAFPIQELTLPLALQGADIIGQARTGTGKTFGFGLPLLQRIDVSGDLQALVIVPTRELCMQVAEDLTMAGRRKQVKVSAVYGGVSMDDQVTAIKRGAHLIVGTPGRLLDLCRRNHLDLSTCRGLVLDEADEMLDLGFLPDVEELISQVGEDRQTMLFSATMPAAIIALGRRYMKSPTFMRAETEEDDSTPDKVEQFFFLTHRMNKPALCARILSAPDVDKAVVFCSTKRMADKLSTELSSQGLNIKAIHSGLSQDKRERTLKAFRSGKLRILCATEVAARGLDIDDVTHVINFDTPDDEKMYLHRIGRTGRAGHDGVAVTLVLHNELPRMQMILRELDIEAEIPEMFSTSPELVELFDLGPVTGSRKRTNAYGTVELEKDKPASHRKPKRKVRGGEAVRAEVAPKKRTTSTDDEDEVRTSKRRRTRVKQVRTSPEPVESPPIPDEVDDIEVEVDPKSSRRTRTRKRLKHVATEDKPVTADTKKGRSRTDKDDLSGTSSVAKEDRQRRKPAKGKGGKHRDDKHRRTRGGANRAGAARPKPKVRVEEARGSGKPLLRRPMRIDFLP